MYFSVHNGAYLTIGTVLATVQYTHQDATIPQKKLKSDMKDIIYLLWDGMKCFGCDVGEFVKTHCNKPMGKSQCKPCPRDTFSQTRGGATSCQDCTPCSHGAVETSSCTATSDTVCACPKGTEPIISNDPKHGCKPSPTEYETTTKHSVSSSQEYQSRTTTQVPASSGYETKPTDDNSDLNTIILWAICGFCLAGALIIVIYRCCIRKIGSYNSVAQYSRN